MRLSASEFKRWKHKAITLIGMSGVGKTRLARILRRDNWFHYSCDYRIGTRYLDESILDNIKHEAMSSPLMRQLLLSDSIHISNNMSIDNLKPVSSFLGKLGDPERGGLGLAEFRRRQRLHREAEIDSLHDVPDFIRRSREVYGYDCFVNDAGGSLCELLDSPGLLEKLAEHTLILYIRASEDDAALLVQRAREDPKPLYFQRDFLDRHVAEYMRLQGLEYAALIDPDDFSRWIFPRLFQYRLPRYQSIADRYGYTVASNALAEADNTADILDVVEPVLETARPVITVATSQEA